jgi:hypothetical protein
VFWRYVDEEMRYVTLVFHLKKARNFKTEKSPPPPTYSQNSAIFFFQSNGKINRGIYTSMANQTLHSTVWVYSFHCNCIRMCECFTPNHNIVPAVIKYVSWNVTSDVSPPCLPAVLFSNTRHMKQWQILRIYVKRTPVRGGGGGGRWSIRFTYAKHKIIRMKQTSLHYLVRQQ